MGDTSVSPYSKIEYVSLMSHNPTKLYGRGDIDYYEHPIDGDIAPIIAVHHGARLAVSTGFYDTHDFQQSNSGYAFCLHNGELMCEWERDYKIRRDSK